jgi:hypothetical protein
VGFSVFQKQEAESMFPGGPEQYWTLGVGLVATIVAATYVSRLAKVCHFLFICLPSDPDLGFSAETECCFLNTSFKHFDADWQPLYFA